MNGADASTTGVETTPASGAASTRKTTSPTGTSFARLEQPDAVGVGARLADQLVVGIDATSVPGGASPAT